MSTLVATSERLGVPDETLFRLSSEELWKLSVETTADWRPTVRELYAHADTDTFFPITIRAAERVETSLIDAVAAYERVMLPRGFDTVDSSLRLAGQLFGGSLGSAV